jgi:hypothetical protein
MTLEQLTLVMPAKADLERDSVAEAWCAAGGDVERLDRFWEPSVHLERTHVRLYGNDTFCLVVAQKLGLTLITPDDRVLATAPAFLTHRRVRLQTLAQFQSSDFPVFVKPAVPKQFRARVFDSLDSLCSECAGLPSATEVLVSELVRIRAEARAFTLDAVVRTVNVYDGTANHDQAAYFAERVLQALEFPRTCVIDVGLLDDGRWIFIETNASWGAGLNGCDPHRVAPCIAAATAVERQT